MNLPSFLFGNGNKHLGLFNHYFTYNNQKKESAYKIKKKKGIFVDNRLSAALSCSSLTVSTGDDRVHA